MAEESQSKAIAFKEFFEALPPGSEVAVDVSKTPYAPNLIWLPDVMLHCETNGCGGVRRFSSRTELSYKEESRIDSFVFYACKNCGIKLKKYAISLSHTKNAGWVAQKIGEYPAFGAPVPARAIALVGPDRELFLKGRRCENQGLGIAAYSYYRRVIESQKNRIFDELIRVLSGLSSGDPLIDDLRRAKEEVQFSKSVAAIKHALPQGLLINGHNPLMLLHAALSQGLHAQSDEECLRYANAARTVLFEFAERLSDMLKSDHEIVNAISVLVEAKGKKSA